MDNNHKYRILHVIYCMDTGGIENWLMNLLRVIKKDSFQMDFLVLTTKSGVYDQEILDLGSKLYRCPWPNRPFKYSRNFKKLINNYGPYNVIHSHVHHYSGWVLRSAHQVGIPVRIAHSHSDITELIVRSSWIRKTYYLYMKYLVKRYASVGIAVSKQSAISLFGPKWENDPRWQIVYCGIDMTLFNISVNQTAVRRKLGIPSDALVLGHVGRFSKAKNHPFIIDVFSKIVRKVPSIRLLLVGDGEDMINIKKLAYKKDLDNKIIFTGLRSDVVELMRGAMDIFLFPSLWEGLGRAMVEAQAAGLPCVLSEHIPHEAEIVPQLIYRVSLSKGVKEWTTKIVDIHKMKSGRKISQNQSLQMVLNSPYNVKVGALQLESIYRQE